MRNNKSNFEYQTWRAINPSFPPATKSAVAVAPSINAQNTLWMAGGSGSPLDDKQSMTSDPESEEVTKYNTIAKRLKPERKGPICPNDLMTSNHICSIGWQDSFVIERSLVAVPKSFPRTWYSFKKCWYVWLVCLKIPNIDSAQDPQPLSSHSQLDASGLTTSSKAIQKSLKLLMS